MDSRLWDRQLHGRKFSFIFNGVFYQLTYDSMQTEGNANHFVSIGINFGVTLACVIPTWIVLSQLEHSHEVQVTVDDVPAKVHDNDTQA